MFKILKWILSAALIVAIAIGVVAGIMYLTKEINPSEPDDDPESFAIAAISDEGEKLYAGGTYSMPKAMTIIADAPKPGEYSPEGVITITATVDNSYINGIFDFTYYFIGSSNEYSSWSEGKNAGDYISVRAVSSNSAKVTLLAPFGAPIEIKAQLIGTDSTATCRVDYMQRIINADKIEIGGTDFGDEANIDVIFNYGIGTVKGDWELTGAYIALDWDFIDSLESYLKFNPIIGALGLSSLDIISTNSDDYCAEFIFGTWEYSMFIKDFKYYSEQQKNAVYYAWYAAYKDFYFPHLLSSNLLIDIDLNYTYQGVYVSSFHDSDRPGGCLSGEYYGDISPDVEFNGNVTF